jgi:MFS family permease
LSPILHLIFLQTTSPYPVQTSPLSGGFSLRDLPLQINTSDFAWFFSIYSFPNIILVIVGGILIDHFGNRKCAILFCILVAVGSGVVALVPSFRSSANLTVQFAFMLIGRFIFGMGAESSYVVQDSMCVEWFRGRHLAKAMGFAITVSRLGSILAFMTAVSIANFFGQFVYALWFAFLLCVVSLGALLGYILLDRHAKKNLSVPSKKKRRMRLQDIKRFRLLFWLGVSVATTIYCSVFAFRSMTSELIASKWNLSLQTATLFLSIIDLTSLVTTPFFGWIVDVTGLYGWLLLGGNALAVMAYLLFGLTSINPLVSIVMLGIHFSLMPACMWPAISLLVDQDIRGTAYATVSAVMNAALTGMYPLSGYIGDNYGLMGMCLWFAGVATLSVGLTLALNIVDARQTKSVLNKKPFKPKKPSNIEMNGKTKVDNSNETKENEKSKESTKEKESESEEKASEGDRNEKIAAATSNSSTAIDWTEESEATTIKIEDESLSPTDE